MKAATRRPVVSAVSLASPDWGAFFGEGGGAFEGVGGGEDGGGDLVLAGELLGGGPVGGLHDDLLGGGQGEGCGEGVAGGDQPVDQAGPAPPGRTGRCTRRGLPRTRPASSWPTTTASS
jgi:hypothetical protein